MSGHKSGFCTLIKASLSRKAICVHCYAHKPFKVFLFFSECPPLLRKKFIKKRLKSVQNRFETGFQTGRTALLFYMPHCDLLFSNWSINNLNKLMILGNSFNTMVLNTLGKVMLQKYSFIIDSIQFVSET